MVHVICGICEPIYDTVVGNIASTRAIYCTVDELEDRLLTEIVMNWIGSTCVGSGVRKGIYTNVHGRVPHAAVEPGVSHLGVVGTGSFLAGHEDQCGE
jgi:hypothetical protein